MDANDGSNEDVSFDWSSDSDEQESTIFYAEAYPIDDISCNSEVIIDRFVAMGFSERIVAKAIEENGEDDEALILDSLLTYVALEESAQQYQSNLLEPWPPGSESNYIADDVSDMDSLPEIAENLLEKEKKGLSLLVDMGYTAAEAMTAMDKCGPDAEIAELTDFISAAKMEMELDAHYPIEFHEEGENSYSHDGRRNHNFPSNKKRKLHKDVKGKSSWCLGCDKNEQYETEDKVCIPHPMIGFGVPDEPLPMVERKLPEAAAGPPYFYFENVACAPKGTWSKLSRFLYDIKPEFVDSMYFCACKRKRGYIHNLPIHNRFPLVPRPPSTIHEALPLTKKWWPSWDSRTKLNCILSCQGTGKVTERIRQALERYDGEPPRDVKRFVLEQCRKWNLVWVGKNKVAPLEHDEMEMLLGYPKNHTRGGGASGQDRYRGLGNSFQVDTVAYHLSVLKEQFSNGINVLSLFSGIGGAEVALHRLGIPLKNVVSVEKSEVNRNILRSWWKQTNQCGQLIEVEDVQEVTGDKLAWWLSSFGGFDLVIGGSPCNNLSGINRVSRVGLDGKHSSLFYDYFRILDLVKCIMGNV